MLHSPHHYFLWLSVSLGFVSVYKAREISLFIHTRLDLYFIQGMESKPSRSRKRKVSSASKNNTTHDGTQQLPEKKKQFLVHVQFFKIHCISGVKTFSLNFIDKRNRDSFFINNSVSSKHCHAKKGL